MNSEDRQVNTLFVYCNFLGLLSTTGCSQNINKSKNYLERRYRIRHWIPMFFGRPCSIGDITVTTLWPRHSSILRTSILELIYPDMTHVLQIQNIERVHIKTKMLKLPKETLHICLCIQSSTVQPVQSRLSTLYAGYVAWQDYSDANKF